MKLRTYIITILLVSGLAPLIFNISLNLPGIIGIINEAEVDAYLLNVQQEYQAVHYLMERRRESLRALSMIPGAIEIAHGREAPTTKLPFKEVTQRLSNVVQRWYANEADILAVRIFDPGGNEQAVFVRETDGNIRMLPDSKLLSVREQYMFVERLAGDPERTYIGSVIMADSKEEADVSDQVVVQLCKPMLLPNGQIGLASIDINVDRLCNLPPGSFLFQSNKTILTKPDDKTYIDPTNNKLIIFDGIDSILDGFKPAISRNDNGSVIALFPLISDNRIQHLIWVGQVIKKGKLTIWLQNFRTRIALVIGSYIIIFCLISIIFAGVVNNRSRELLKGLHDLLTKQRSINLNWQRPAEFVELSQEVSRLSEQYLDNLKAREQSELERHTLQKELYSAQKMEAIGLMAGGVAHDLNNILSGIISYPELLLLNLPKESKLRQPLEAIHKSGRRASDVVADLLTVARGAAAVRKVANPNDLINEYLNSPEFLRLNEQHHGITCNRELDPALLNISCSPIHISKCVMNLVTNAMEAISENGCVTLTTKNKYIDKPLPENQHLPKGEYIIISVSDSGVGISDKDIDHIFEPFYSRKVMGRSGTGLGLAVVWNTMKDHLGTVGVLSSSKGTTFELYFPATQESFAADEQDINLEDLKGHGEKILLVDDEPQQLDIATKMLTILGYHTDSVSSGEEALEYLQNKTVDLVLLDMIMDPGMNGCQTYERITEINPEQKSVIVSGFSKSEEVEKAQSMGAGQYIKKPYSIRRIGLAIKQALH